MEGDDHLEPDLKNTSKHKALKFNNYTTKKYILAEHILQTNHIYKS